MSKVTSKFQVTLPRTLARAHRLTPGKALSFESSGNGIRLVPQAMPGRRNRPNAVALFDQATERQAVRNRALLQRLEGISTGRGWTRDELYEERVAR